MTDVFKPEEFAELLDDYWRNYVARVANTKLNSLLGPRVTGFGLDGKVWAKYALTASADTHEAFLFNIQPIKKPCEKHEPSEVLQIDIGELRAKCKVCGGALKATWEEA